MTFTFEKTRVGITRIYFETTSKHNNIAQSQILVLNNESRTVQHQKHIFDHHSLAVSAYEQAVPSSILGRGK